MHFSYLDIVLGLPLIWAIYQGWVKGLILQLAMLIGICIGIWGAGKVADYFEPILRTSYGYTSVYLHIMLYAISLVAIVILVYLLGLLLTRFVKIVALGIPNRLAGVIFALLKYWILMSFVVFFLHKTNDKLSYMDPTLPQESFFYNPMLKTSQWIYVTFNEHKKR